MIHADLPATYPERAAPVVGHSAPGVTVHIRFIAADRATAQILEYGSPIHPPGELRQGPDGTWTGHAWEYAERWSLTAQAPLRRLFFADLPMPEHPEDRALADLFTHLPE